jgi:dienelactone hydrolase
MCIGITVAQDARFDCPRSSCWCRDSFDDASIQIKSGIFYREAFNSLTNKTQTLYLDEYVPPPGTRELRPGAIIVHGGGFSTGPHNGCSHGKDMKSFADIAMMLARRGFVAVSIDYRCEGPLRPSDKVWGDAVEDARAAVNYMVANSAKLSLDPSRIFAFGGSAGAATVGMMNYEPDGTAKQGNVTCVVPLSGSLIADAKVAGKINASSTSPPYLDFHGTNDSTVPYSNATKKGGNDYWGTAIDTKIWLDAHSAPNYLCAIPGRGHVPFDALHVPPYNVTLFGFLLEKMKLAGLKCPAPAPAPPTPPVPPPPPHAKLR